MWDSNAQVCKLIDFGTARFSNKSRKVTQGLGTEGYAPPELYSTRADVTFSADMFTVGAVMYELLTGESPEPKSTPRDFRGYDPGINEGCAASSCALWLSIRWRASRRRRRWRTRSRRST
jgi:serine/threonine-protein kinase